MIMIMIMMIMIMIMMIVIRIMLGFNQKDIWTCGLAGFSEMICDGMYDELMIY